MSNSAFRTFSMRRPSIHIRPLPSSEAQRWTCLGVYVIDFAFRLVILSPLCVLSTSCSWSESSIVRAATSAGRPQFSCLNSLDFSIKTASNEFDSCAQLGLLSLSKCSAQASCHSSQLGSAMASAKLDPRSAVCYQRLQAKQQIDAIGLPGLAILAVLAALSILHWT